MSTRTAEKIYTELKELRKETKALRELFFLIIKDSEGEYKESFIKKIIKKYQNEPQCVFTDKKDFLKQIS